MSWSFSAIFDEVSFNVQAHSLIFNCHMVLNLVKKIISSPNQEHQRVSLELSQRSVCFQCIRGLVWLAINHNNAFQKKVKNEKRFQS
jgi:hypothetical protein